MAKNLQSIDFKVLSRIYGKGRGWVFTPNHFVDLGSRKAVASALARHQAKGTIRNLARGLYNYPKYHPQLGLLTPSIDDIALAIKGRDSIRLQPSEAYAANLLGLSEQVPMQAVFLSDGPARKVKIGKQVIELKRTVPKNVATEGRISGLVIQALRYLGKNRVNDGVVAHLRKRLSTQDKEVLIKDLAYAPDWMVNIMRKIAVD
jgi:hypothetical protein